MNFDQFCEEHAPPKPENLRHPKWWVSLLPPEDRPEAKPAPLKCQCCGEQAMWLIGGD